jgi:hypothetical protein
MGAEGYYHMAVMHPAATKATPYVYHADVDVLASAGLIQVKHQGLYSRSVEVLPSGNRQYEAYKNRIGEPAQRVEAEFRQYLDGGSFGRRHGRAYDKWLESERLLWGNDATKTLSLVGHLCREALQEFAESLAQMAKVQGAPSDPAKTVDRLRLVADAVNLTGTRREFADALITYWGTVSDLVQRQEHAMAKQGDPIVWEDARRAVFQTLVVMFEWDRAVSPHLP